MPKAAAKTTKPKAKAKKGTKKVEALLDLDGNPIVAEPEPEKPEKIKKPSPFDYINAINFGKQPLLDDPEMEKYYNPFITNRALSLSQDTVMLANIMNKSRDLPHKMQFEFLRAAVRPRKRYETWPKPIVPERIRVIMDTYKYSIAKAIEVSPLISDEQIQIMIDRQDTGGLETQDKKARTD